MPEQETPQFLNKKIRFLDPMHGFWRLGTCYKQDKKTLWVRNVGGKRSKVRYDEIEIDEGQE